MENPSDQTTQQLMFSLIEIWRSSNLTQQEFCREKDLNYQRFARPFLPRKVTRLVNSA
jgi:hypothetical protein